MLKHLLRAASLISALTIGGVLVARASGCTNEKRAPVATPATTLPATTPAGPDAGQPDAGVATGRLRIGDTYFPATKAGAPVFHGDMEPPPPEPHAQQASPKK